MSLAVARPNSHDLPMNFRWHSWPDLIDHQTLIILISYWGKVLLRNNSLGYHQLLVLKLQQLLLSLNSWWLIDELSKPSVFQLALQITATSAHTDLRYILNTDIEIFSVLIALIKFSLQHHFIFLAKVYPLSGNTTLSSRITLRTFNYQRKGIWWSKEPTIFEKQLMEFLVKGLETFIPFCISTMIITCPNLLSNVPIVIAKCNYKYSVKQEVEVAIRNLTLVDVSNPL